jgi:hypothetical protein
MKNIYYLLFLLCSIFYKAQEIPYEKIDSITTNISNFQALSNNLVYNDGKETFEISFPDDNFQILISNGQATRAVLKKSAENTSLYLTENIDLSKVDEIFQVQYPGSAGVVRMSFPEGVKTQIYTNGQYSKTDRDYFLEFFYDRSDTNALKTLLTQLNDLFVFGRLGNKAAAEQFELKDKIEADKKAALAEKKKNVKELTVDDIIKNFTNAFGGSEKLRSIKSVYSAGTLTTQGYEIPFKTWSINNEGTRMDMEIQGKNNITVTTKTEGWTLFRTQNHRKPVKSDATLWRESAEELDLTGDLFDYKAKGNTAELIEKVATSDHEFYNIKVIRKSGTVVNYYLDTETFLVKQKILNKTVEGKVVEFIETAGAYSKNADGFVYATSYSYKPVNIKIYYTDYEVNKGIDSSIFENP